MPEVTTLSETRCELGEGPVFDPARQTLFWFDILGCKRHALHIPGRGQTTLDLPEMASAMAVIDARHDLILTETGFHILDTATGVLSLHVAVEADNPATRSNDARVHPSGAFWFGTMGKEAENGAGAIYRYYRESVAVIFEAISIPNAICFSPDGRTGYFTDTATAKLMKVAVDPADGSPTAEPEIFFDHSGGKGGLDGAIVDADGNLWNTRWGASALDCYTPDGKKLLTIDMPAKQVSCPAFVGDGLIAVTSALQGMDAGQRERDPKGGNTFLVKTLVQPKYEPSVAL